MTTTVPEPQVREEEELRALTKKQACNLQDIAQQLRIDCLDATEAAGSGHLTSAASMAEIMAVLFFRIMHFDARNPRHPCNDRLVLSKGHACPVMYAAWAETGLMEREKLLSFRRIESPLEGHPTPRLDFIDVATGSLGNGLSNSCGMAYAAKYLDHTSIKVFCILGDGELMEGSNWEACSFASYYKLDNLYAIVDVNRLGQSSPTTLQYDLETYRKRFEAFGWDVETVDGHSVTDLYAALHANVMTRERPPGKPFVLLARTVKGRGIEYTEDKVGFHGKICPREKYHSVRMHLTSLLSGNSIHFSPLGLLPEGHPNRPLTSKRIVLSTSERPIRLASPPSYEKGDNVATRDAYGTALCKIGEDVRIVVMSSDVKDSTRADKFVEARGAEDRYIECFIAEQNMVAASIGIASRGRAIPFASTFACFFTRAHDQLRMGAISGANIKLCGSHCGVSVGEDGPSQMGLEDIAMFRSLELFQGDVKEGRKECVIFYPSDAIACERAVELAANVDGMAYIRTTRPETEIIYDNEEQFLIGEAKVVRRGGQNDVVTVIGAGVTLMEALKAAVELAQEGISIRVIDPFTVKPLDKERILKNALETNGQIIVVEDHYLAGGLGEAVASALSMETKVCVTKMAVTTLPRSGRPDQLLDYCGISARHIKNEVMKKVAIVSPRSNPHSG